MKYLRYYIFFAIITIVTVLWSIVFPTPNEQDRVDSDVQQDTVIEDIIYDQEATGPSRQDYEAAKESAAQDCSDKGGEFNECASLCAEGEICAQVCVWKCEFE